MTIKRKQSKNIFNRCCHNLNVQKNWSVETRLLNMTFLFPEVSTKLVSNIAGEKILPILERFY